MTDIVEWLRAAKDGDGYWPPTLADRAADEIERLRAALHEAYKEMRGMQKEIERLRAALECIERKTRAGSAERAIVINEIAREALKDDGDPTPWCHGCGAMEKAGCDCGPIAETR